MSDREALSLMTEGRENRIGTTSPSSLLHLERVPSVEMRRGRLSSRYWDVFP
jgi:hypothetical protein